MPKPIAMFLTLLLTASAISACAGGGGDSGGADTVAVADNTSTVDRPQPQESGDSEAPEADALPPIIRSVYPEETDPHIDQRSGSHLVALPQLKGERIGQLFLFFPGTGAEPGFYRSVLLRAAALGYHAISLDYPNALSVNYNLCPGQPPECRELARLEILTGQESPYVEPDVDVTNSAYNRLAALLRHQRDNYPGEGWEAFLTAAGEPDWRNIAAGGHSQGGGHAAMTARLHELQRVLLFGATEPAPWTSTPFATPPQCFRALVHDRERARDSVLLSWDYIGIPGSTELVTTLPSPQGATRMLTVAEGCSGDPASNGYYHNCYIVDGWMPPARADGTPAFAPLWDSMLAPGESTPSVPRGATALLTPAGESWIDPEVARVGDAALMTWQDPAGGIWLADIDPVSGLPAGEPVMVGTQAAPLGRTYNGPEIGIDRVGPRIYYTRQAGAVAQAVRVDRSGRVETITTGPEHFSPLPTQDAARASTRLLMLRRPPDWGTLLWLDSDAPAQEHDFATLALRTDGDARWVPGSATFVTTAYGEYRAELFLVDTDTGDVQQISNDGRPRTTPYAWRAPEVAGDFLVLAVVDDTQLEVWAADDGSGWHTLFTVQSPSLEHPFLGSPEPFVAAGRSFVSLSLRSTLDQVPGVTDAQIWLLGIDAATGFAQRCDDGAALATRIDPETLPGSEQVFVYYYTVDASGSRVSRCATGIRP